MSTLTSIIARGTRASQPLATSVSIGALYYVTDEYRIERSNGTSWDPFQITGMVLLEEHSASASASLNFTTRNKSGLTGATFQSDFDEYVIEIINLIPATDNTDLTMRCSTNGGVSYDSGANYARQVRIDNAAFNGVGGADSGLTSITWFANVDTTVTQTAVNGTIKAFAPLNESIYKAFVMTGTYKNNDTRFYSTSGHGWYLSTTAVNALQFLMSSGNIASGTIRIYGVNKS